LYKQNDKEQGVGVDGKGERGMSDEIDFNGWFDQLNKERKMITIKKSKTADTRSCDFSQVTIKQLSESSIQHIEDVIKGMIFFQNMLRDAGVAHDIDKLNDLKQFHSDFIGGFKNTTWWDNHRKITRHHLLAEDGVPKDVNLIDVLEMIVDCVMAGMGRTGTVYPLEIKPEVLMNAFNNTADLLKKQIEVED
jgi:protein tyrosine phosphatase